LTNENWITAFNSTANPLVYTYDKASNVLSATDFFSSLAYTYDHRNRVKSVDNQGTQQSPRVVLNYTYDVASNLTSVAETIDGVVGATTSYAYDALNRTTRLTQAGGGTSDKRVDLVHNPLGQVTGIERFSDLAGTQSVAATDHVFDALNRLTSVSHRRGATTLASDAVSYDPVDRVMQQVDGDGTSNFVYDNRDQLRSADHTQAGLTDESFTYDANGNRVSSVAHGSGYQTGPGNRLLTDGTFNYQYDAEGNMVRRTEIATGNFRTYLYDHRNRITFIRDRNAADTETISFSTFRYDTLNRRIFRSEERTPAIFGETLVEYFVFDRDDVLLEFSDPDGTNPQSSPLPPTFSRRYLHGPAIDQVFAEEDADGALWHFTDHLGSTTDLVDSQGEVQNHVVYDSFGRVVSQSDPTESSRYLFTGREFESLSGLYYYRARFYDPTVGRFLSEDPLGFGAGDVNPYRYVGNDPLANTDPLGLCKYASANYVDEIKVNDKWTDPMNSEDTDAGPRYRTSPSEPWQPLVAGMDLQSGDEVYTRGANVVVKIGGTAILHLEPDTVLKVPQTNEEFEKDRAAYLERTSILEQLNPLRPVTPDDMKFLNFPKTKDAIGGIKLRPDDTTYIVH
jgi:RHS repeat-associated protein